MRVEDLAPSTPGVNGEAFGSASAPFDNPEYTTVLRSSGPLLVKRWHLVDGKPICEATEHAATFSYRSARAEKAGELAALLRSLDSREAIIPGCLLDGLDPADQRRVRCAGGKHEVTIADRTWLWFPFDLDSLAPFDDAGKFDPLVEVDRAIATIRTSLPGWAQGCKMVIQLIAGHGMKPGIRARVFVRLAHALSVWAMRAIAERDCADVCDMGLYQPERLIYCGPPVFEAIADPVAQRVFTYDGVLADPPAAPLDEEKPLRSQREKTTHDRSDAAPFPFADAAKLLPYISPWGPRQSKGGWLARLRAVVECNYSDCDDEAKRRIGHAFMRGDFYTGPDKSVDGEHRGDDQVGNVIAWSLSNAPCGIDQLQGFALFGGWRGVGPGDGKNGAETFAGAQGVGEDAGDEDAKTRRKYLPPDGSTRPPVTTRTLQERLNAPHVGTRVRPDLFHDLIEAGKFIPVRGRGGYHKSRVIEQACFCMLYDRELFTQRNIPESGIGRLGSRSRDGIAVGHIDMLSYEQSDDARQRRVDEMKTGFKTGAPDDPRGELFGETAAEEQGPIITVNDAGKIDITAFGCEMLRRWEALPGHTVIWLDSFWDAVEMTEAARNNDGHARRLIAMLNRWCRMLDCTILSPLHPSRSGQGRGDTGYAPAFDNKPQQVIEILATTERDGTEPNRRKGTGEYVFHIWKWNEGPQGVRIPFWFDNGQLVSTGNVHRAAANFAEAAVKVATKYTYGVDATAPVDDDLERGHPTRITLAGKGEGLRADGAELTTEHSLMQKFRDASGTPNARVRDLAEGLVRAVRHGMLGYRESDQRVASRKRLPAGYHRVAEEAY